MGASATTDGVPLGPMPSDAIDVRIDRTPAVAAVPTIAFQSALNQLNWLAATTAINAWATVLTARSAADFQNDAVNMVAPVW